MRSIVTRDFVFGFLALLGFSTTQAFFLPVLPVRMAEMGSQEGAIGTAMAAFTLVSMLVGAFAGRAVQRIGHKRSLLGGVAVFLVVPWLFVVSSQTVGIGVIRLLQGAGWAVFLLASVQFIARTAPAARPATAIGLFMLSSHLGLALGPMLAGIFSSRLSFQELMIIPFVCTVGAAVSVGFIRSYPRPAETQTTQNTGGNYLQDLWGAVGDIRVGVPVLAFSGCVFVLGTMVFFVPLYALDIGVNNTGVFFTAFAVSVTFSRLTLTRLADRFDIAPVFAVAIAFVVGGTVMLAFARSSVTLAAAAAVFGTGFAVIYPMLNAYMINLIPRDSVPIAVGLLTASADGWVSAAGVLMGHLAERVGFTATFLSAAVFPVLSLAIFLIARPRMERPRPEAVQAIGS